jgi:hypothetical protein
MIRRSLEGYIVLFRYREEIHVNVRSWVSATSLARDGAPRISAALQNRPESQGAAPPSRRAIGCTTIYHLRPVSGLWVSDGCGTREFIL